jgi:hypothetical protein
VCNIIDCFWADQGDSIDASTGRKSDLCFNRRHVPGMRTIARVRAPNLAVRLQRMFANQRSWCSGLAAAGFPQPIGNSTYERLTASGHAADKLDVSSRGFHELVRSLGFETVQESLVRALLAEHAGHRSPPSGHCHKMANYAEVEAELSKPSIPNHLRIMLRRRCDARASRREQGRGSVAPRPSSRLQLSVRVRKMRASSLPPRSAELALGSRSSSE